MPNSPWSPWDDEELFNGARPAPPREPERTTTMADASRQPFADVELDALLRREEDVRDFIERRIAAAPDGLDRHRLAVELVEHHPTALTYARAAALTAVYPGVRQRQLFYPAIGMVDEACEVLEKVLEAERMPYTSPNRDIAAPVMLLAVAIGKLMGVVKKAWRDDLGRVDVDRRGVVLRMLGEIEALVLNARIVASKPDSDVQLPGVKLAEDDVKALRKELGDVPWYWAMECVEADIDPDQVLIDNAQKLFDRASRKVLGGSGDDR
jgi:hypothetical protein